MLRPVLVGLGITAPTFIFAIKTGQDYCICLAEKQAIVDNQGLSSKLSGGNGVLLRIQAILCHLIGLTLFSLFPWKCITYRYVNLVL